MSYGLEKPMMHSEIEIILESFNIPYRYVSDHIVVDALGDVTYWTEDMLRDRIS